MLAQVLFNARVSTETRILIDPGATFRELAADPRADVWTLVRRPLLMLIVFACLVSLQASGRLSVRLIVDGAVSFAFVPLFELFSLAIVYRRGPRQVPFARAVDLFFASNSPWLFWIVAFSTLRCLQTPRQATAPALWLVWTLELSLLAVAAWSARIDLHFFRHVLPRTEASPMRDLLLQRAIGWTCTLSYFFGIAAWPEIIGRMAG